MRIAKLSAVTALLVMCTAGCGLPRLWPWGKKSDGGVVSSDKEIARTPKGAMGLPKKLEERFEKTTLADVQSELSRSRGGLRLVIRTDKDEYKLDEPIVLDLRLENVTGRRPEDKARDIPVYFEPFAKTPRGGMAEWLFKFYIRSEADQRVVYESPRFKVSEAARAKYYHFATLPSNAFVGRTFAFPAPRVREWLKPGKYSFVVSYEVSDTYPYVIRNRKFSGPQVELLGTKLAYVRVWTGKLYSNRLVFRVKAKKHWWLLWLA